MNTARFQDDVLSIIANAKAHAKTGNQDGEESLSYVLTRMREKGWKNLDQRSRSGGSFEELLQANGFTLRQTYKGGSVRTYVGV